MRGLWRRAFSRTIAFAAIFAIAGTLSACGRYGRPVRVSQSAEATVLPVPTAPTEELSADEKIRRAAE